MPEQHVELRVPEDEPVALVDQRHVDVVAELLRERSSRARARRSLRRGRGPWSPADPRCHYRVVSTLDVADRLGDGLAALVAGDWETARGAFEDVVRSPTTRRRSTGSVARSGGCETREEPSSTGSGRTPASGASASLHARHGSRSGSRASTRSSGGTALRRTAGWRAASGFSRVSLRARSRAGLRSRMRSARPIRRRHALRPVRARHGGGVGRR